MDPIWLSTPLPVKLTALQNQYRSESEIIALKIIFNVWTLNGGHYRSVCSHDIIRSTESKSTDKETSCITKIINN